MNLLRLRSTALLPIVLAGAMLACGDIADPTQSDGPVATVKGSLTGTTVPAGAHVAVVWKTGQTGLAVGTDVAIVDGHFTMSLPVPPDSYFFEAYADSYDTLAAGSQGPGSTGDVARPDPGGTSDTGGTGGGAPSSGGGAEEAQLLPQTEASGGITEPMQAAIAGFVVYVDANGNGELDLEGDYASSPDTILGGNDELLLTYLKGGGQLDYEKLRDRSGILPVRGFNLAWNEGRWVPLDLVELKLEEHTNLPGAVCSGGGAVPEPAPLPPEDKPTPIDPDSLDGGAYDSGTSYPDPNDPNLHCSADGRSYYVDAPPVDCPTPPPRPEGLCSFGYDEPAIACAGRPSEGAALAPGEAPPADWPCPVAIDGGPADAGTDADDAGPAPDAGT